MNSKIRSTDANAIFQQAHSLRNAGRLDEAATLLKRLLANFPKHPRVLMALGTIALQLGKLEESVRLLGLSLNVAPDQPKALLSRSVGLRKLNRPGEALASCDRAIALKPDYVGAHVNRGTVLRKLKRFDEALASHDRAIALKPDHTQAHVKRGVVLQDLERFDEALASYERAIALKPDHAAAHVNRAEILIILRRVDEALASYERAIGLRPDLAFAHVNRGIALQHLKRFDEALASYERAIALRPEYADAYEHKSELKLLIGDYEQGWKLREWRWKRKSYEPEIRNFSQPRWLGGQPVAGKTLLIHAEGGLGDTIQFCRYVPMAEALGATVVLEVPAPLCRLMSTLEGKVTIAQRRGPLPDFDLHCPTMSLPLAFKTTPATIPAKVPYLHADPGKQGIWHQRLGEKAAPRVGLVWSGRVGRKIDLDPFRRRNITLELLDPLLQLPLEFHSLQKDIQPTDAAALSRIKKILTHQEELNDFSDTAALIQEMDLVISIDTSVAHLAGALGRTVWVMLPLATDYRWTADGTGTPWYPTATLFRQTALDDWSGVVSEIARRLTATASPI